MITCDNLLERGGLRKVVYRKEGVKESKGEKKEKRSGENIFLACLSFD